MSKSGKTSALAIEAAARSSVLQPSSTSLKSFNRFGQPSTGGPTSKFELFKAALLRRYNPAMDSSWVNDLEPPRWNLETERWEIGKVSQILKDRLEQFYAVAAQEALAEAYPDDRRGPVEWLLRTIEHPQRIAAEQPSLPLPAFNPSSLKLQSGFVALPDTLARLGVFAPTSNRPRAAQHGVSHKTTFGYSEIEGEELRNNDLAVLLGLLAEAAAVDYEPVVATSCRHLEAIGRKHCADNHGEVLKSLNRLTSNQLTLRQLNRHVIFRGSVLLETSVGSHAHRPLEAAINPEFLSLLMIKGHATHIHLGDWARLPPLAQLIHMYLSSQRDILARSKQAVGLAALRAIVRSGASNREFRRKVGQAAELLVKASAAWPGTPGAMRRPLLERYELPPRSDVANFYLLDGD